MEIRAKDNVYCQNIPTREKWVPFCLQIHLKRCAEPWVCLVLESELFSVLLVFGKGEEILKRVLAPRTLGTSVVSFPVESQLLAFMNWFYWSIYSSTHGLFVGLILLLYFFSWSPTDLQTFIISLNFPLPSSNFKIRLSFTLVFDSQCAIMDITTFLWVCSWYCSCTELSVPPHMHWTFHYILSDLQLPASVHCPLYIRALFFWSVTIPVSYIYNHLEVLRLHDDHIGETTHQ